MTKFDLLVLVAVATGTTLPGGAWYNVAASGLQRRGFLDNHWHLTIQGKVALAELVNHLDRLAGGHVPIPPA